MSKSKKNNARRKVEPEDVSFTLDPKAKIWLDGTFRMPDPASDCQALTEAWALLVIAYEYIGRRFEMSGRTYPNFERPTLDVDLVDRGHAYLRLALGEFSEAISDADARERGLKRATA